MGYVKVVRQRHRCIFILPQLTRLWCRAGRVAHLVEARSERAAVAVTRVAVEATVKDIFPIR